MIDPRAIERTLHDLTRLIEEPGLTTEHEIEEYTRGLLERGVENLSRLCRGLRAARQRGEQIAERGTRSVSYWDGRMGTRAPNVVPPQPRPGGSGRWIPSVASSRPRPGRGRGGTTLRFYDPAPPARLERCRIPVLRSVPPGGVGVAPRSGRHDPFPGVRSAQSLPMILTVVPSWWAAGTTNVPNHTIRSSYVISHPWLVGFGIIHSMSSSHLRARRLTPRGCVRTL